MLSWRSSLHSQGSGAAARFHFPILMMSRWAKLQGFLFWQAWCAAGEPGSVFVSWPLPEHPHFLPASTCYPAYKHARTHTHIQHATFPAKCAHYTWKVYGRYHCISAVFKATGCSRYTYFWQWINWWQTPYSDVSAIEMCDPETKKRNPALG